MSCLEVLNSEQKNAVLSTGDVLVLAGAGSGKTKTIISRVEYLLHTGTDPEKILLLTFTRRAANEMRERLQSSLGNVADELRIGTFHWYCLSMLRSRPRVYGAEASILLTSDDQLTLIRDLRERYAKDNPEFPSPGEIISYISYSRNTNQSIQEYLRKYDLVSETTLTSISFLSTEYTAKKRSSGYIDYDDILEKYLLTLVDNPTEREYQKSKFDHILVDEMQDTNPIQWSILEELHGPAKLFCVGDDAQCIYAFRGADFRNVHKFTERIPGAEVKKLTINYRSFQEILQVSNWLLSQSPLKYDKELQAFRGFSEFLPSYRMFDSGYDEAEYLARELKSASRKFNGYSNLMVLSRTAFGFRKLEAVLRRMNIPYRLIGGSSLANAAHVKDLLSLMRCVSNPKDYLAWFRFLCIWKKVGKKAAEKLISVILASTNLEEIVSCLKSAKFPDAEYVSEMYSRLASFTEPASALRTAINFLLPELKKLSAYQDSWFQREKDFDILLATVSRYSTVSEFLDAYILNPDTSSDGEDTDKVTLITVHSAKGTEADCCWIIQAQSGMFPHVRSLQSRDAIEEERRILYVALTRAKNYLHISGSYDVAVSNSKSFLESIPESIVYY